MHDELTRTDIEKMQEELHRRRTVIRPQLLEAVKEARAFGDLSENFEYKAAKREKNQNESRIRYLEGMIRTARVIQAPAEDAAKADTAELFDRITLYHEALKREMTIRIVTTLRQNALQGLVSKESPVAQAVLGHRVGERVEIVSPQMRYFVVIKAVEKGTDDASLDISSY